MHRGIIEMQADLIKAWVAKNKWLIALIIFIFGGYTFGKDLAMRDNNRKEAPCDASCAGVLDLNG